MLFTRDPWPTALARRRARRGASREPRLDHLPRRSAQHARGQRIEIDFLEHGEAIFIRHAQIEEKNIGLQFGEKFDALRAVLRFANDGDIFVGIEKLPQAIAKNRVVVG